MPTLLRVSVAEIHKIDSFNEAKILKIVQTNLELGELVKPLGGE
jgi:hypothetical protein